MGAHDRVAPDLPGALGVIVMPFMGPSTIESPLNGTELRRTHCPTAAQDDPKTSRVPAYQLGGYVLGEQISRILFARDFNDVQFIVSDLFLNPQELCGDVSQLAQPLALDDAKGRGGIAGNPSTQVEAEVARHGHHTQRLGRTLYECV